MQPPILTTEFTFQIERHIAPDDAGPPAEPMEVRRFGNAVARKVRAGWPASGVFCFQGGDVGRIPEILQFFGDVEPVFYLAHCGFEPAVGHALRAAGFEMDEWKQTILYGLPLSEPVALPAGITVEPVTPENIEAAAEVAAEGNGWHPAWRDNAKAGIRRRLGRENTTMFLARFAGAPAGIGTLSGSHVSPRWCGLSGGAVIPPFRRQGVHTALLRHRLHVAFQNGCDLVIGAADFGTPSFRNQQRLGLRLAYVEATWKRTKPS